MRKNIRSSDGLCHRLIDLKPDEASALSLVADYAKFVSMRPHLEELLCVTTPRAQKIGRLILDGCPGDFKNRYGLMAKRFIAASANNHKQMRLLRLFIPRT